MIAYILKLRHVENNAFNKMNHVAQHVAGLRYCENTESGTNTMTTSSACTMRTDTHDADRKTWIPHVDSIFKTEETDPVTPAQKLQHVFWNYPQEP